MSDKQNLKKEERNKNRVYSSAINKCKNPIWKQIETNVYHSPDAWLLYYYTTIDFLSQFIYNTQYTHSSGWENYKSNILFHFCANNATAKDYILQDNNYTVIFAIQFDSYNM